MIQYISNARFKKHLWATFCPYSRSQLKTALKQIPRHGKLCSDFSTHFKNPMHARYLKYRIKKESWFKILSKTAIKFELEAFNPTLPS